MQLSTSMMNVLEMIHYHVDLIAKVEGGEEHVSKSIHNLLDWMLNSAYPFSTCYFIATLTNLRSRPK